MNILIFLLLATVLTACSSSQGIVNNSSNTPYTELKTVKYNNTEVQVVIDKPEGTEFDLLVVYHGTVSLDSRIVQAAYNTLAEFKKILQRKDMMIVSVAYPEENLLFGDNIRHSEAALLWVQRQAAQELNIKVKKVFIAGHSQGGYIVTRLNTMHKTDGVIANAPGPLNLVYRCQLEEKGDIPGGAVCTLLRSTYGTTSTNPNAYFERSLLHFTSGFTSPILFVQGLNDSPIQMYSWQPFKDAISACTNCQQTTFLDLPGFGHTGLFESTRAIQEFNNFINK